MIIEKIMENKKAKIKQWPVRSNRASSLGHECLRYLVLERTRWEEKTLHNVGLQLIFDEGNLHERAVLRDIEDAGYTTVEQQRPFELKEYAITGHIDCKVLFESYAAPTEIKSMSPFIFPSIDGVDSLINSRYPWVRRYPAQLTLYLLMDEKPWGLFIFKNKQSGELKEVRIDLDHSLAEKLIKKAKAINEHVSRGTLPDVIPYDDDLCDSCGYVHICLPEMKREAVDLSTDPELEQKLDRREELKPLVSEYNALDKKVKKQIKDQPKILCGPYLITGKIVERKAYVVEAASYWKTNIKRLEEV